MRIVMRANKMMSFTTAISLPYNSEKLYSSHLKNGIGEFLLEPWPDVTVYVLEFSRLVVNDHRGGYLREFVHDDCRFRVFV